MLKQFMIGEWTCLASDADANAPVLFEKFLSGALPKESVALLSDGITGEVFKIEFAGKKYVLKRDRKRKHRFEKLVTSFFAGSNAFRLLRGLHCRVNLIRFHAIPDSPLHGANEREMLRLRDFLTGHGLFTTIRASRGEDIFAACGMLSTLKKQGGTS